MYILHRTIQALKEVVFYCNVLSDQEDCQKCTPQIQKELLQLCHKSDRMP